MTDPAAAPITPPGWQRQQELLARLADIGTEVDEARSGLPSINDPTLRDKIEDLLAAASELVAVHGTKPSGDVGEALAGLQSATRQLHIPVTDPELGTPTEALRMLRAVQGRLRSAVDDALDAATASNRPPVDIAQTILPKAGLPLQAMTARLIAVAQRLDLLEEIKSGPTDFVQQPDLVAFYVGDMRVELALARVQLRVGDTQFDLGSLRRAAESMAGLTEDFAETVGAWIGQLSNVLSPMLVRMAHYMPLRVSAVTSGVSKLARIALGRAYRAARAEPNLPAPLVDEAWLPLRSSGSSVINLGAFSLFGSELVSNDRRYRETVEEIIDFSTGSWVTDTDHRPAGILTGRGGTGKSALISIIKDQAAQRGIIAWDDIQLHASQSVSELISLLQRRWIREGDDALGLLLIIDEAFHSLGGGGLLRGAAGVIFLQSLQQFEVPAGDVPYSVETCLTAIAL